MDVVASREALDLFSDLDWRVPLASFVEHITSASTQAQRRWVIVSLTWVKALATHMSHEFVQFVVEDTESGSRRRLIADRQETGDWVSITSAPGGPREMSEMFEGMGSRLLGRKGQTSPYKDRHTMPLPLVSVKFDKRDAPTLRDMAALLSDVSSQCKEYNPLREHCWWFSEQVILRAHKWHLAQLIEWEWSRWRYSFVIVNKFCRRPALEMAAREFEQYCLEELRF